MKKAYKNKRDQYKAELDEANRKNDRLERAERERKKGLSCNVYCSHCQIVYGAVVPRGGSIKYSGCAHCGVSGTGCLVSKMVNTIK